MIGYDKNVLYGEENRRGNEIRGTRGNEITSREKK